MLILAYALKETYQETKVICTMEKKCRLAGFR